MKYTSDKSFLIEAICYQNIQYYKLLKTILFEKQIYLKFLNELLLFYKLLHYFQF